MIGEKRRADPSTEPLKYPKEDPLYPLYHPDTVTSEIIDETAQTIFKTISELSFISPYNNLFEASIEAVKKWKALQAKDCVKVYEAFVKILSTTQRFATHSNTSITLTLNDAEIVMTPHQLSVLRLFSDTIDKMCSGYWSEKNMLCIKQEGFTQEIFFTIVSLLQNSESPIVESICVLDLISCVEFLQIPHLKKALFEKLRTQLRDDRTSNAALFTIFDYLLVRFQYEKDLINDCFDAIHHALFVGRFENIGEISFQSPTLQELIPALKGLLHEDYAIALENLKPFLEKNEWAQFFYQHILIVTKDKEQLKPYLKVEDSCTNYRCLILLAHYHIYNDPKIAENYLARILKLKPDHLFIHGLYKLLRKKSDIDKSIDYYLQQQIKLTPHTLFWRAEGVRCLVASKHFHEALEECEKLFKEFPEDKAEIVTAKIEVFLKQKEYLKAIALADEIVASNSTETKLLTRIFRKKAISLSNLGRYTEALDCIEKAQEIHSSNDNIHVHIDLLFDLKRYDAAELLINQLPNDSQKKFNYTCLLLLQKKFTEAEKLIAEDESLNGDKPEQDFHALKTLLFVLQNKLAEASTRMDALYCIDRLHNYISGFYCLKSKDYDQLLNSYDRKTTHNPFSLELCACALYNLGDVQGAKAVVLDIKKIDEKFPLAPQLEQLVIAECGVVEPV